MFRHVFSVGALVAALVAGVPSAALAGERTLQLRTTEDPNVPADPAACPFATPNLRLGATVWSHVSRADSGEIVDDQVVQVGVASACGVITSLAPSSTAQFYVEFTLGDGVYAASGTCTVISNDVPAGGLVLAGCTLRLVRFPQGIVGGAATSLSVFNPRQLSGFSTGSYWTLRLYTTE